MVRIRLARSGFKKNPFYYIVVTDSRNPRDGRFIERIGFFNPINKINSKIKRLCLNKNRVQYWLEKGAKPSNRVSVLIKKSNDFII